MASDSTEQSKDGAAPTTETVGEELRKAAEREAKQFGGPSSEVIEPYDVITPEILIAWLTERRDNCLRILQQKDDHAIIVGWLDDARHFDAAIAALSRSAVPAATPAPAETVRREALPCTVTMKEMGR